MFEYHFNITDEDNCLIVAVCLLQKLHLVNDSFTDYLFQIIKVLFYSALVDKPAKPVRIFTVKEIKMIFDEVSAVRLALYSECIGIEVLNGYCVVVNSSQRNEFLFLWTIDSMFAFISAHDYYLCCNLS